MVEPNLGLLVGVGVDPEGEKGAAPGSMAGNQAPVIWDPRARGKPEASRELGQASRTRNRSGAAALGVAQAATWPQTSRFPPSPPRWTGGTAHLTRAEPGSPGRGAGSLGSALHCRPQHAAAAPGASFASPCPQVPEPSPPPGPESVSAGLCDPPTVATAAAVAAALHAEPAPPAGEVSAQSPPQPPGRQTQHRAPPRCHKHPGSPPPLNSPGPRDTLSLCLLHR